MLHIADADIESLIKNKKKLITIKVIQKNLQQQKKVNMFLVDI